MSSWKNLVPDHRALRKLKREAVMREGSILLSHHCLEARHV